MTFKLNKAILCGSAAGLALMCSQAAWAQSAPAAEEVFVTGSRTISDAANSPTPLTIVTTERLLATTPSNISDALLKVPVLQASSSRRNASNAGSNAGGAFLNLRNFGQQRTLTLLDGMRVPASNAGGSVDVSILPQMLMSRVDVVTGGGSAVYGSDAITGVVNFILDKRYEGVKYSANAGISDYGDGASYQMGVAAGTSLFGGRGHIEGSLQYYHADGVYKKDRPGGAAVWSSYGLGTAASPFTNFQQGRLNGSSFSGKIIACGTGCTVNGQQFVDGGNIVPFNAGYIPVAGGGTSSGGDGVYVHNTHLLATTKHAEAFTRFSYNLDDDTTFWVQGTATEATNFSWFFPSQIDTGRQTVTYFKNNPFLSAAARAQLGDNGTFNTTGPNANTFQMAKWLDNQPGRGTRSTARNLILSAGLDGQIFGKYDWRAFFTHGESRTSVVGVNNGNNQYQRAQSDVVIENGVAKCWNNTAAAIALYGDLYPGCVPLNPFGYNSITDDAFHYWSRDTRHALTNTMDNIAAQVSGDIFDLPAGPIRAALSGEMRWLGYDIKSDASPTALVNCTGLRLCGNPATQTLWDNDTRAAVSAEQNVWEFAAEATIPILKDIPFFQSLEANVAGRYTNYSTSGAVQTWKLGVNWALNDTVRVRSTTSVDIRAPTLNDLYQPTSSSSVGYFDLLTNSPGPGTQQVSQGNPNLVPEVSRTYTAGIVLTPSFIPNLTASVDFYTINLKNAIGNVSGTNTQVQALCNSSNGTSQYCTLYQRRYPFGNPLYTDASNYPIAVLSQNLNAAFSQTEGVDYEVNYSFRLADISENWPGQVTLRSMLNVSPVNNSMQFPGASVTRNTAPKGRFSLFGDYTLGNWSVSGQLQWFSGFDKNGILPGQAAAQQVFAVPRVGSFNTIDININKKIQLDNGSAMQVYLSVQNIANSNPPIVTGSSGNPGFGIPTPGGEDIMGRYFTIGVRGNL